MPEDAKDSFADTPQPGKGWQIVVAVRRDRYSDGPEHVRAFVGVKHNGVQSKDKTEILATRISEKMRQDNIAVAYNTHRYPVCFASGGPGVDIVRGENSRSVGDRSITAQEFENAVLEICSDYAVIHDVELVQIDPRGSMSKPAGADPKPPSPT